MRASARSSIAARSLPRRQLAHAVHVSARGLEPVALVLVPLHGRRRRQRHGPHAHRTRRGRRTRQDCAFALASCQHYEHGHYTAYRDMAAQDLDFVVHVGDYIYESSWGRRDKVREHHTTEPVHARRLPQPLCAVQADPHLQAAHAACPWLVTWDDHEVDNDYANDRSQDLDPVEPSSRAAPPPTRPITSTCRCRPAPIAAGRT